MPSLGNRANITIIEPDPALAIIAKKFLPDTAVVESSKSTFMHLLDHYCPTVVNAWQVPHADSTHPSHFLRLEYVPPSDISVRHRAPRSQ